MAAETSLLFSYARNSFLLLISAAIQSTAIILVADPFFKKKLLEHFRNVPYNIPDEGISR